MGEMLNQRQRKRLLLADRLVETGRREDRDRARAILREIESQKKDEAEAAALAARFTEQETLEKARGEWVERSASPEHKGRMRIRTRDGLLVLRDSGRLGPAQFAAGLLYRRVFEAVHHGELGSQLDGRQIGGSSQPKERLAIRAHNDAKRLAMEAIASPGRELTALRLVAGEGRCISHFAKGGSSQALYAQALAQVLGRLAAR